MTLDKVFEALASQARREILAYLSGGELTTSDLVQRFEISAPAISRHLAVLLAAELVVSERRGQYVYYGVNRDKLVSTLTGFAFELCPVARPLKRESKARGKKQAGA